MSDLTPITREEALLDGADLEPITRKEQFIKRIYDKTQEVPTPITREEWFLKKAGEGTSPVTIEQLNATENGTYSEEGKAYSPVIVEVPQTTVESLNITANGTYTAPSGKAYSPVTVNVEGFKKKSIANTPTDIASFNDGTANPMPSLEISIEPQQDLHGYDNPWVGGAGKNKFHFSAGRNGYTWEDGCKFATISENDDGITVNGTATSNRVFTVSNATLALPAGTYTVSVNADNKVMLTLMDASDNVITYSYLTTGTSFTLSEETTVKFQITIMPNVAFSNTFIGFQIESGNTTTSWTPYSNICPISGHTEADVTVTDDLTTPTETHTTSIPFHDSSDNPITVYGGTLNVTSGELKVTHANIASYNGETINEPWISSMDVYSAGATPTTGAQVVYPLATPQTYQLTPAQVSTLLGQNNIFTDCGQILEGEYFVTL